MDELAPPTPSEEFLEESLPLMGGQTPQNVLLRALWVLRDPNRWVAHCRAADIQGNPVPPTDPRAYKWCLEGAVAMASNPDGVMPPYFMKLLDEVVMELYREECGVNCLEEYCYHGHIVRVLQRAIERVSE